MPSATAGQERGRGYHLLLAFLLSMFLLGPVLRTVPDLPLHVLVNGAVVFGSLGVVLRSRGPFLLAAALGVPLLVLLVIEPPLGSAADIALSACHASFDLFLALLVLSRVLRHRRVSAGTISGSLCVYLLLGVAFAYAYAVAWTVDPSSFRGLEIGPVGIQQGDVTRGQLLYFSLVTLTTLGYGDVAPASLVTRNMAACEALLGQLFLVAVVARLVGLQISHSLVASRPSEDRAGGDPTPRDVSETPHHPRPPPS
jgi:hypothetical protein